MYSTLHYRRSLYKKKRSRAARIALGSVILCVFSRGHALIYRRVGTRLLPWVTVIGTQAQLLAALAAARELDALADGAGGWAQALRLGLYPTEPIQAPGVIARLFCEHGGDS